MFLKWSQTTLDILQKYDGVTVEITEKSLSGHIFVVNREIWCKTAIGFFQNSVNNYQCQAAYISAVHLILEIFINLGAIEDHEHHSFLVERRFTTDAACYY